nr:NAD(P)/FAD-dependent oxidoreductase [Flavobacterium sp.]
MEIYDMKTIVVGAGAAGLMAAYELSRKGVDVMVLEANDRIGGRVHTFIPRGFTNFIEAGAEFIHGNLPLTLGLMKKAKLEYIAASLEMTSFGNGQFFESFDSKYWSDFAKYASRLKRDCTLSEFLNRYFPDKKHEPFRKECHDMAQGLDLADPDRLSMFCIRQEWTSHETQYRPVSGYAPLLGFLADSIARNHGKILFGHKVEAIEWQKGGVEVSANSGVFLADSVIVTTTLGNLQNRNIAFEPRFDDGFFDEIGFGEVLKIVFEFEFPFWEETQPDLGFLFTEEEFTFWTQLSLRRPILVGWIGNDRASELSALSDEVLSEKLLAKLSEAFPKYEVKKILRAKQIFRYTKASETNGGYSWTTTQSKKAISQINKGIENTIWFAGEAFERTGDVGTVESAFQSGRYIARKILKMKI